MIGGANNLAVVLHQDERVAQVAKMLERLQQAAIVAWVQPDGRLVEDVEDAGQAAADLAGQANTLRLAAGERRRRPGQRHIVQADIDEKLQAISYFAQHFAGDLLLVLVKLKVLEEGEAVAQGPGAHVADGVATEAGGARIIAQPRAGASGAGDVADQVIELVAIDEADASRLAERGHHPFVLETGSSSFGVCPGPARLAWLIPRLVQGNPGLPRSIKQQPLLARLK